MSTQPNHDDTASVPTPARRRLLRGLMGAAAVMPVGAGATTAIASNMRCVYNTATPGIEPLEVAGTRSADKLAADGLARVPLYKSTASGTSYVRYWVKGADLSALRGTSAVALPSGVTTSNWLLSSSNLVSPAGSDLLASVSSSPTLYNTGGRTWSTPTQDSAGTNRYVAVRFDANGNMLGTSDYVASFTSPANNSAMTRSCWTSFSGVNFSSLA